MSVSCQGQGPAFPDWQKPSGQNRRTIPAPRQTWPGGSPLSWPVLEAFSIIFNFDFFIKINTIRKCPFDRYNIDLLDLFTY